LNRLKGQKELSTKSIQRNQTSKPRHKSLKIEELAEYFYIRPEALEKIGLQEVDVLTLEFSKRTLSCFRSRGIETVGHILRYSKVELLQIPNFGKKCLREVENTLRPLINKDFSELKNLHLKMQIQKEDLPLELPITRLYFSVRTENCLKSASIDTVEDLFNSNLNKLIKLPNFGKKSLKEVEQKLLDISYQADDTGEKSRDDFINQATNNLEKKFISNKRNNLILVEWNTTVSTLEDIAKNHDITRERVRQILVKAKKIDLEVLSKASKSKMRAGERDQKKIRRIKIYLGNHKEDFLKTYLQTKNLREI
jgi:DNA-directed RNA polymerase alpha subunit